MNAKIKILKLQLAETKVQFGFGPELIIDGLLNNEEQSRFFSEQITGLMHGAIETYLGPLMEKASPVIETILNAMLHVGLIKIM